MSKRTTDQLGMFGRDFLPMSPVRRQYLEQKAKHPDALLFFRLGDFYETFDEDAGIISRELDIVLTSREMGRGERVPMAGVPAAAVDSYVANLIARGYRVAICDQLTEPTGRGPVERGVVRVISPGTVVEDGLVNPRESVFLVALLLEGGQAGLAYLDASTGYLAACQVEGPSLPILIQSELLRINPSECLIARENSEDGLEFAQLPPGCRLTARPAESFAPRRAAELLRRHFRVQRLEALGIEVALLGARAAAALLSYLDETLPSSLAQFQRLELYDVQNSMLLDGPARRNLEIVTGLRSGTRDGSLLEVLDRTGTPMGARLLRRWLSQPLLDLGEIRTRQDAVEELLRVPTVRTGVAEVLRGTPDLERLAGRCFQGRLSPRDCLGLSRGLSAMIDLQRASEAADGTRLDLSLDHVPEASRLIDERMDEEPPTSVGRGMIRAGFSPELDELRALSGDSRRYIADLEQRERERTGVRGIRVGHNRVYGYFLEVSQATTRQPTDYYQQQQTGAPDVGGHLERLGYVRKQTLAGAERYLTSELKEYELRASRADEEAERLERRLLNELLELLKPLAPRIMGTAVEIARLDCLVSLAAVAQERGYVRPLLDDSPDLVIEAGRHPIVEAALGPGEFVPNDLVMAPLDGRVQIVTGPNMAGKSTVLRMTALLVLMAQVGSFVPASAMKLGLVDRIFTRIGAQDDLAGQRSTFMVEMTEAASILRNATPRSLVVLDEVGRGTSTFDGMALARAILEHLYSSPGLGCRTLFATHYHELADLEDGHPGIRSSRMEVLERGREVVFLHRLVSGAADRSYGIHVARLAGVPSEVTTRAEEILVELEASRQPETATRRRRSAVAPLKPHPALNRLRQLDLENTTPIQALSALQELQALVEPRDPGNGQH